MFAAWPGPRASKPDTAKQFRRRKDDVGGIDRRGGGAGHGGSGYRVLPPGTAGRVNNTFVGAGRLPCDSIRVWCIENTPDNAHHNGP